MDITSFIIGLLAGGTLIAALAIPRVGRLLAQLLTAILLSVGVGVIVWGIVTLSTGAELTTIRLGQLTIAQPAEVFGWGGGLLIAGVHILACSFRRRSG